jgi:hypothetical protein
MSEKTPITDLSEALKDPSYRIGWTSNIAMSFKDNLRWYCEENKKQTSELTSEDFHVIANKSAEYFLWLLERPSIDENDVMQVAEKLYYEANPNTKMDVPSFVYEKVEAANKRRISQNSNLSLYDFCKQKQAK